MMTPSRLVREMIARLDGPHSDKHTADVAEIAAESIRYLNYATGTHSSKGLVYPATVYSMAAELSLAATRMKQLFGQLSGWLADEEQAGYLGTDDGSPATDTVIAAISDLSDATRAAEALAVSLNSLQATISGLNGRGPGRQEDAT